MTAHPKKEKHARPIRKKRDFEGAAAAAKRLSAQAVLDAEAERRLQALLHEMDKFDEPRDDDPGPPDESYDEPKRARRWSDDSAEDA